MQSDKEKSFMLINSPFKRKAAATASDRSGLDKALPLDGYLTIDRIFNLLLISSSQKTTIKPTVQAKLSLLNLL